MAHPFEGTALLSSLQVFFQLNVPPRGKAASAASGNNVIIPHQHLEMREDF